LQDAREAREMGEAGRQWVRQAFSGEDYAGGWMEFGRLIRKKMVNG
jgi:hypothetical protein